MKKRYKYGELYDVIRPHDSVKPLDELLKHRMPVKASYQLAVIANKIAEFVAPLESVRFELIKQYGTKEEDGWHVKDDSENAGEFQEKLEELFEIESDEWVFNKVTLPEDLEIEPSVLMPLVKLGIVGM